MGIFKMNDLQDNNEKQGATAAATGNVSTGDADLINAENNVFPVANNSQVILPFEDLITFNTIKYLENDAMILPNCLEVEDSKNNYGDYKTAEIKFINPITKDSFAKELKSIYLKLSCSGEGAVNINGQIFEVDYTAEINTFMVNLIPGQTIIPIYAVVDENHYASNVYFNTNDIQIIVDFYNETEPNIKTFDLCDKAQCLLDLNSGETDFVIKSFDSSEFVLPLAIAHIYNTDAKSTYYGKNLSLNIDKKLIVSKDDTNKNTRYLFTDELGDEYVFSEKYYYFDNGRRVFIAKSEVTININGELSYSGNPVYKHQSCRGYTLIPEINDYISSDLIEQRQSEQIELEDFINSCEASLINYVKFNTTDYQYTLIESLTKNNINIFFNDVNDSADCHYIVITESEAFNLKSANEPTQSQETETENETSKEKILIKQARKNLPLIKDAFLKYFRKKAELEQLVLQTPVNFLKDENGVISGFNKQGNLVLICDSYGNYVNIVYDNHGRVSSVYDNNNKTMQFEYANNLLQSITDGLGRTVKYQYDGDNLFRITYPDGETTTLQYILNNLSSIKNSDGKQFNMSYEEGKLNNLTKKRYLPDAKDILKFTLTYSDTKTEIKDDEGNGEYYEFDEELNIIAHKIWDSRRFSTEKTYSKRKSSNKSAKIVRTRSAPDFEEILEVSEFNELDQLFHKFKDWHNISAERKVRIDSYYEYDINNRLIQEKTIKRNDGTTSHDCTFITNYNYNAQGSLVLTENYVEDGESRFGKNYEKRVYDENGNLTKTICWNSLDSSSKFYSESDYAENGQVASDRDETGEISAEYNYVNGTNVVNSVKYANGSAFAYGRHPQNFSVTSVTQSTEDGESNTTDIVYEYGRPAEVKSGNTIISYTYDQLDRKTNVKINNVLQTEYSYEGYEQNSPDHFQLEKCSKTLYTESGGINSVYLKEGCLDSDENRLEVIESFTIGPDRQFRKYYNAQDELVSLTYRYQSGEITVNYTYDSFHNLTKVEAPAVTEDYQYNSYGNRSFKGVSTAFFTHGYSYAYKDNTLSQDLNYIVLDGKYKFIPKKDVNGRNTGRIISNYSSKSVIASELISYRKVGDHATNMPATVWFGNGKQIKDSIKYRYDKCGNITEILENGHTVARYAYDKLNRIIREDNKPLNRTTLYTYDQNGNITERCEYAYTFKTSEELSNLKCTHASYDYEGDRLISYNGEYCEYNNLGKPLYYRGENVEWQYGTRLTKLGATTFAYDGLGRRTRKNGIQFLYDNENKLIYQSYGLEFIYDTTGVAGLKYKNSVYFYRKDAQGNIIAILDSNGEVVVKYNYDAWGRHNITDADGEPIMDADHIAYLNPFRYRGYYYDTETRLYYLQTRYYDPETGRFISQDDVDYAEPEVINGINLYAYCGNNPVMGYDPVGTSNISTVIDIISTLFEIGIGGGFALYGWAVKSAPRPNNIGIGIYNKFRNGQLDRLTKASNVLSKISTVVAVASVIFTVVDGIKYDIERGYSTGHIISNAVTNTVVYGGLTFGVGALGGWLGSLAGSIVPGLGNVVGAAVGYAVGLLVGFLLDLKINGKSIIDHIRDAFYSFWKWLFG